MQSYVVHFIMDTACGPLRGEPLLFLGAGREDSFDGSLFHSNSLQSEQPPFPFQPAREAGEFAAGAEDPVTGNHDGDGIGRQRLAHRHGGASGAAKGAGQASVRLGLSPWHTPGCCVPHGSAKRGVSVEIQGDIGEIDRLSGEIPIQFGVDSLNEGLIGLGRGGFRLGALWQKDDAF